MLSSEFLGQGGFYRGGGYAGDVRHGGCLGIGFGAHEWQAARFCTANGNDISSGVECDTVVGEPMIAEGSEGR